MRPETPETVLCKHSQSAMVQGLGEPTQGLEILASSQLAGCLLTGKNRPNEERRPGQPLSEKSRCCRPDSKRYVPVQ